MPIYEYYSRDNHTIYQFYAKTLAQGRTLPRCPDNPKFRMEKIVSAFAVTKGGKSDAPPPADGGAASGADDDPRMDAAMEAMEKDFADVDENDPKAMGRMMRRMAELSGEKIDGEMEEVVRKLEEGADPESLEEQLGGEAPGEGDPSGEGGPEAPGEGGREARHRFRARRAPRRDPQLYDYE